MWKIPLFDLDYGEAEKKAVNEVLEDKWLSSGNKTTEFETKFSTFLSKDTYATAVSSATAALHISLLIANVKPKDEVIISGLTFVADANVVRMIDATPIFCDINSSKNWNPSIMDIKKNVNCKTKAIIIVHFAGYPIEDIEELVIFCKERNIILIEDVAHAVGASYKKQKCGTFGDMACFSFFSNKNLSTGEGGMFVTKHEEFNKQAKLYRSHGMTSMTIDRHEGKTLSYDVVQPGLNYRIDEMRCALGLVQLKKLEDNNLRRKKIVTEYIHKIEKSIPSIVIPFKDISENTISSFHIFPILLPKNVNRENIMCALKEKGIQTSIHYPSFKDFSYYSKYYTRELKNVDEITTRILTLPLYPTLKLKEVRFIVEELKELL